MWNSVQELAVVVPVLYIFLVIPERYKMSFVLWRCMGQKLKCPI